jgi:tryptophan 2,3-dioxygenase
MGEGITTDFSGRMSYGDYLGLDRILSAQKPLSGQHDETLFIVIHQVQELWLKLMLHEMDLAMRCIRGDELRPAFKATARISRIQRQMIEAWDVLTTMTPHDYLAFREALGAASGFQSFQYRLLEFRMGAKDPFMMKPHAHRPEAHAALRAALEAPSIYDEALRLLARRGHPIPAEVLGRDVSKPHESHPAVVAAWAAIYGAGEAEMELYELAEELVDLEDGFGTWRFRHMRTVERIIGHRRGTGGSAGVAYLKNAVERRFFPELYEARTAIA